MEVALRCVDGLPWPYVVQARYGSWCVAGRRALKVSEGGLDSDMVRLSCGSPGRKERSWLPANSARTHVESVKASAESRRRWNGRHGTISELHIRSRDWDPTQRRSLAGQKTSGERRVFHSRLFDIGIGCFLDIKDIVTILDLKAFQEVIIGQMSIIRDLW